VNSSLKRAESGPGAVLGVNVPETIEGILHLLGPAVSWGRTLFLLINLCCLSFLSDFAAWLVPLPKHAPVPFLSACSHANPDYFVGDVPDEVPGGDR